MKHTNKIEPEFTQKNLTPVAGLNPVFQFLDHDLDVFSKLDQQVDINKKKKDFFATDYYKVLFVHFILGLEKLKHLERYKNDAFLSTLLDIPRLMKSENITRCFLSKFSFKETHQVGQVNATLLKKKHKQCFSQITRKRGTIDVDSTPRNTSGHQEATGKHYKKHNGYHPILAYLYETKELLHSYLRPGNTYTSNGFVGFIRESVSRLPYSIQHILWRTDSGFFSHEALTEFEEMGHEYVTAAKLYPTLLGRIQNIPDDAYRPFEDGKEITTIHYCLPDWKKNGGKRRKFVIVRTIKAITDQLDICQGDKEYTYQAYCANMTCSAEETVLCYRKRGNGENYIKELKRDLNMETTTFDSFWENEAFFQIMGLVYNSIIWFKATYISVRSAIHERFYTFRYKFIFVAGKLKTGSRQLKISLNQEFPFKELFTKVFNAISTRQKTLHPQ